MLLAPYNQSYTAAIELPARADATPTFAVYSPAGASLLTGSVTLDGVNTTLSGAASAGATTVSVTSATGIAVGRKYLVGGAESSGGESITVKSISGTTITLVRPLLRAKSSGDAFASPRVTVAITTAVTARVGKGYRIEITYALSSTTQPVWVASLEVVRYTPTSTLKFDDLLDRDPVLLKRLPAGLWVPALIDSCWQQLLLRVSASESVGGLQGVLDLSTAHSYLVRATLAECAGPEWAAYRDDMRKQYESEVKTALSAASYDTDQDGAVEPNEGFWPNTFEVSRG